MRLFITLVLLLTGLSFAEPASLHGDLDFPNLDLVKDRMREYYTSGRYLKEVDTVAGQAREYLETNLARHRQKPAIVLDIDETTLSNYPHLDEYDFAYIQRFWRAWVERAEAPPLKGPLELFRSARQNDVAVFFITGRSERDRNATVKNLQEAGFEGYQQLIMRENGSSQDVGIFKRDHRRKLFEQGYTIVVNLGDQLSDLEGGYAESTFKLPNPMYYVP